VTVTNATLEFSFYTVTGALKDKFSLTATP
jgi:hypothetical protein